MQYIGHYVCSGIELLRTESETYCNWMYLQVDAKIISFGLANLIYFSRISEERIFGIVTGFVKLLFNDIIIYLFN